MQLRTIKEAALILGVGESQLRRGIAAGRYAFVQVGNRRLVDVEELRKVLEAEDALLDVRQAARLTGVSESTLRRMAKDKRIPYKMIGRGIAFQRDELLKALEGFKLKK